MPTAIVIGAGVAGTVCAIALQQAGIDPVVCEAYPRTADDVGAFLTLQGNGLDALRAVDAQHVVTDLGFRTPSVRFFSGTGKRLGDGPLGAPGADGAVSTTLKRADLYRALLGEAVRRGVRIEHGRRLVDVASSGTGVTARFADGSRLDGDLLVGCDGLHSVVRAVIDPGAPPARFVPVLNIGGYARGVSTDARPGEYVMVFGKRAFFGWTVAPDGEIWWFANPPRAGEPGPGELAAVSDAQWRALLLDLFASDRSPATEIIRATRIPLRGWATYDVPNVPTWHRDSMIVIGDAAHATSPSSGQGASMAIEDAVVLAQCLRDIRPVPAAFAAFELRRRDRVERVVAEGAKWSNTKAAGPVARVVRDAVLPVLLRRAAASGGSTAWVYDHHIEWAEPVASP